MTGEAQCRCKPVQHFLLLHRVCKVCGMTMQVEQLYREEALNRKKIFNAMEDLKVRKTSCAATGCRT